MAADAVRPARATGQAGTDRTTARELLARRWRIACLTARGGWAGALGLTVVNLVLGVLPVVYAVAGGVIVGQVPPAVAGGVASPAWHRLVVAFVVTAVAFGGQQLLAPLQSVLGDILTRRIDGQLADRLIAASLYSPGLGPLEDQRMLDDLSEAGRHLEHGIESPGRACAAQLALLARYVRLLGYLAVVGALFSWIAAVALGVATVLFRYAHRGGLRRYAALYGQVATRRRRSEYLRQLAMFAPAAKEIRVFGLGSWLRTQYRTAYLGWLAPIWASRRSIYLWPHLWISGCGLLVTAVVLALLGWRTAEQSRLTDLAIVLQAALGAVRLGEYYAEADMPTEFGMRAHQALLRYEAGARSHGDGDNGHGPTEVPAPQWSIAFDGITFRYPGADRPVFERLSLTLPAGRCTAIVGVNGAGKTTLIKLLTRLYEPQAGAILVDGWDLRLLPLDAWRRRLAVVFQDFNRYEVSAADNIGFGFVERLADWAGIAASARSAGVGRVLRKLPDGPDTRLVSHVTDGTELSGGQWQRIAIARALFALRHGASVLVLDEPTASLDVRAEARFFEEFARLTRGSTTVLISHRFSTVRHADRIVVVEQGRAIETGSHDELMRRGGRYAELFRLQAERFHETSGHDEAS